MKKSILFLASVILLIGFCYSAIALSSNLKSQYERGETAIIKLQGNIQEPISKSQMEIKRNNVLIPVEYDIKSLNGTYYAWFITPENPGNYSMIIKGVSSISSGNLAKEDFIQNFSVLENKSDYSIKPGFVISSGEFEFIINGNEDSPKSIQINYLEKQSLIIQPGKNTLAFNTEEIYGNQLMEIEVGKYKIPAYLSGKAESPGKKELLLVEPDGILDIRLLSEKNIIYTFSILNSRNEKVEDIYFQYDDDIFSVTPGKKISLLPGERAYYNITLKSNKESGIKDFIYIKSDENNVSFSIPVDIAFTRNVSELIANKSSASNRSSGLKCSEFSGKICSLSQECLGDKIESTEGICCIGECKSLEKGGSGWLGYLIASFVIIGILFIFFKFYKKKNT